LSLSGNIDVIWSQRQGCGNIPRRTRQVHKCSWLQ
jgi:hypothetical protein